LLDIEGFLEAKPRGRVSVGIGLSGEALRRTITEVGPRCPRVTLRSFRSPAILVSALHEGEIDAAVRGTMPSSAVLREIRRVYGLDEVMRAAMMSDASGRQFVLLPVGIDEGMTARAKRELVLATVRYFAPTGWKPSVGVLSKGRPEDRSRSKDIARSLAEGERLAASLRRRGVRAEHRGILIEDAVSKHDLIVAPDGVSGNLIFRTLHFLGGCRAFGAPIVNLPGVFVDTSRAKADFSDSVRLAASLATRLSGHR